MKNTLLVLLLLLSGCVATKEVENATYMQVSDEDQVVLYDSVYFKSSNVIRLETNEKSLLRGITKLCCDDGKMFIFDDALDKIVIFDMNGNYLNRVCYLGGARKSILLQTIFVWIQKIIRFYCFVTDHTN